METTELPCRIPALQIEASGLASDNLVGTDETHVNSNGAGRRCQECERKTEWNSTIMSMAFETRGGAICLGDTTLMAHGFGQSPPCPLGAPSSTQKQIHNARLVAFSNVGSSIQLLIPDRCLEEVMGFLKELEAKRGSGPRVRIACA